MTGFSLMRVTGLEPAHLKAQEPKSCVSANFTTPANKTTKLLYIKSATMSIMSGNFARITVELI